MPSSGCADVDRRRGADESVGNATGDGVDGDLHLGGVSAVDGDLGDGVTGGGGVGQSGGGEEPLVVERGGDCRGCRPDDRVADDRRGSRPRPVADAGCDIVGFEDCSRTGDRSLYPRTGSGHRVDGFGDGARSGDTHRGPVADTCSGVGDLGDRSGPGERTTRGADGGVEGVAATAIGGVRPRRLAGRCCRLIVRVLVATRFQVRDAGPFLADRRAESRSQIVYSTPAVRAIEA